MSSSSLDALPPEDFLYRPEQQRFPRSNSRSFSDVMSKGRYQRRRWWIAIVRKSRLRSRNHFLSRAVKYGSLVVARCSCGLCLYISWGLPPSSCQVSAPSFIIARQLKAIRGVEESFSLSCPELMPQTAQEPIFSMSLSLSLLSLPAG